MNRRHIRRRKFTPEEMDLLAANPFTCKVTPFCLFLTLEFKNLFLSRYQQGVSTRQIFEDAGFDTATLGDSRIFNFAFSLMRKADAGELLTESRYSLNPNRPVNVDYNTLPAQQSVSAMQREMIYLRQQIDFLKKLTELGAGKKRGT